MTPDSSPDRAHLLERRLHDVFHRHERSLHQELDRLEHLVEGLGEGPAHVFDDRLQEARRISHRLTGSLGLLGVTGAARAAARIQSSLHDRVPASEVNLPRLVRLIRRHLERHRRASNPPAAPDCG